MASAATDVPFVDSRDRVIAAIDDLKDFAGDDFPHLNGERFANAHVVVDSEP